MQELRQTFVLAIFCLFIVFGLVVSLYAQAGGEKSAQSLVVPAHTSPGTRR